MYQKLASYLLDIPQSFSQNYFIKPILLARQTRKKKDNSLGNKKEFLNFTLKQDSLMK